MEWQTLGRWLIGVGLLIALVGVAVTVFGRLPWIGRLPGDIYIKRDHFSFYFPIATCIIISLALSLIMRFLNRR